MDRRGPVPWTGGRGLEAGKGSGDAGRPGQPPFFFLLLLLLPPPLCPRGPPSSRSAPSAGPAAAQAGHGGGERDGAGPSPPGRRCYFCGYFLGGGERGAGRDFIQARCFSLRKHRSLWPKSKRSQRVIGTTLFSPLADLALFSSF